MDLAIIILAAGKGTRMGSDLAKVLHPLGGKPLIAWVLERARPLGAGRTVVVVGHQAEDVEAEVRRRYTDVEFVLQPQMLGTGHAVQQAQPLLEGFTGDIVVTYGDMPLIKTETLLQLVALRRQRDVAATMLVGIVPGVNAYGRVVYGDNGQVTEIVEAKDASQDVLALHTVNAGVYCFRAEALWRELANINNANKSGEFYLTDVVGLLTRSGERVYGVEIDELQMTGVNTKEQLLTLEAELRKNGHGDV